MKTLDNSSFSFFVNMVLRLSWQSTMLIVGPSGQGKSTLARQIVEQRNQIFDVNSRVCFWYYDTFESLPDSLKNRPDILLREGLPNMEELKKYKDQQAMIVIDDLMTKIDQNSGMERLVSVLAHHYDMTIIFLLHTIFYSKVIRNLRLQASYIILFKNNADKSSVSCLGAQLMPGECKTFLAIYKDATSLPYSYLLIDLHKNCPEEIRYRDNILPNKVTHVFTPKSKG
ncbi:hypothetical protein CRE_19842 [Caenorhabditis remanei]|uniref:Helicase superfamily 3 single-stranded DNA/RNA virus domain-containing protein n=1 Tax=Caenorhabditis remanei TaxID=31234 RepID=E3MTL4_CAERE|nr:hypothetical protein CRE_19842 [Caenorhabditis remanei]